MTVDRHTVALRYEVATSQQISESRHFFCNISCCPIIWEQTSPSCCCPAKLQLSVGLWRIQEDGAEGGEDLPGLCGGQLALGPHQAHSVSFPQG